MENMEELWRTRNQIIIMIIIAPIMVGIKTIREIMATMGIMGTMEMDREEETMVR